MVYFNILFNEVKFASVQKSYTGRNNKQEKMSNKDWFDRTNRLNNDFYLCTSFMAVIMLF